MGIKVKETGPLPPTPEKKGLGWGWDVHKSNLEFKRTQDKLPITGRGKQVNCQIPTRVKFLTRMKNVSM